MTGDQIGLFDAPRLDERPPVITRGGATRATDEAMAVLREHRADLIERAREIAREIARRDGTVHSRQVRAAMADDLDDGASEFWLGAVFRGGEFQWTGEHFTYGDPARNIHERMIKIWRLRP